MKLQFKHQKFQADAAKAVVDVFAGQPYLTPSYMMDRGYQGKMQESGQTYSQSNMFDETDFTGWSNQRIVPELNNQIILDHIQKIQRNNQIEPSSKLEGAYNLTIEMETGVGKTYTYIKTMYELNKHYGWSKFIIVVPSIAIREGVYKSFQVTQEHFAEEYGKKIRFFIYNSSQLTEIDRFASDNSINVMIINSQAFNAKGKDARRIYMKLDEFRSRRPIDIIAKTNPIVIIDEPQSVEGKQTKKNLEEFHPLMTLRYSATHKSDSIYNMVYRLDAMEAYNKKLVKKIAVKGIQESGTTATDSYVYLEGINLSKADPTATIQFHTKGASGVKTVSRKVGTGFNLYPNSGELEEYKNNRETYIKNGRNPEGQKYQTAARDKEVLNRQLAYMKKGVDSNKALQLAKQDVKGLAALHGPDQIAGGRADNITGLGNSGINSSIGSQWKSRVNVLDDYVNSKISNYIKSNPTNTNGWKNLHLDVELSIGN